MRTHAKTEVSRVEPRAIERYLDTRGWSRQPESRSKRVSVWAKRVGRRRFEVLVPDSSSLTDYPVRVAELLSVLEEVERRPQGEIFTELQLPQTLRVTLRVDVDPAATTVRLLDGVTLMTIGVRVLATAAAAAAERVGIHDAFAGRAVTDYVERIRVAPSEAGSYVVPLLLPSDLPQTGPRRQTAARPFGQDVTNALISLLTRVLDKASDPARIADLPEMRAEPEVGILNALAPLSGSSEIQMLSFEISTGRAGLAKPKRVRFDREALEWIRDEARRLSQGYEHAAGKVARAEPLPWGEIRTEGVRLRGRVLRLERPFATLETVLDGRKRRVQVALPSEDDYQQVIEAHRLQREILCAGELVERGARLKLENVYSVVLE